MTGNKNKQDMDKTANQVQQTRSNMEQFRPEYAKQRTDLEGFREKISDWGNAPREDTDNARKAFGQAGNTLGAYNTALESYGGALKGASGDLSTGRDALGRSTGDVGVQRGVYQEMIDDPSKRGYGQDTVNKMYGKLAGTAQGAATDLSRNLNKASAALGVGNTGASMRNVMTGNERLSSDLLGATRDVDLEQAKASREDLWAATKGMGDTGAAERDISTGYANLSAGEREVGSGYGQIGEGYGNISKAQQDIGTGYDSIQGLEDRFNAGVIGAQGQTYDQTQAALQGENDLFGTQVQSYNPQTEAYKQKGRPGFWGDFGNSFATSFGRNLGGG